MYRPSTHSFYLDYNGNGLWNGGVIDRTYNFGSTGDLPVAGDWNLDGRSEIRTSGLRRTCSSWTSMEMESGTEQSSTGSTTSVQPVTFLLQVNGVKNSPFF